mgnify:FL=1
MKCGNCGKETPFSCEKLFCPLLEEYEDIQNKSEEDINKVDETEILGNNANGGEVEEIEP